MSQLTNQFLEYAGRVPAPPEHGVYMPENRITVNGQTSFSHYCQGCKTHTPHARTLESDRPVCGICGTVDE